MDIFKGDVRIQLGDLSELRASLKNFGWLDEFPALQDENGVTLVGHRRLTLAKELGIVPVIKTLKLGTGTEADAERLKLALVSNIGHAPMTKVDRQHIAEHLYGEREWTMARIAKALGVHHATIVRDLGDLCTTHNSKPHAKTATNPKGSGRRKGTAKSKGSPRKTKSPKLDQARAIVREKLATNETVIPRKLEEEHPNISHVTFDAAVAAEKARAEAIEENSIDPASLPASSQKKLAIFQRKLEREFAARVEERAKERAQYYHELYMQWAAEAQDKEALADKIIRQRKGLMTKSEFRTLMKCVHPDSRNSVSDATKDEATRILNEHQIVLLPEADAPTRVTDLPRTQQEWDAAGQRAAAMRRKNGRTMTRT